MERAARASPPGVMPLQDTHLSVALGSAQHFLFSRLLSMGLEENHWGDDRCWRFGGSRWEAVGCGSYGGGRGGRGGRGGSEATHGAGSGPLGVVERTAGAGPAVLLGAAQTQDLVQVGFLARRLTDGAARGGAGI